MKEFERGTQIIYTPPHTNGDISHPDAEKGFVTNVSSSLVFCRFFHKGNDFIRTIRTTANSEGCYPESLTIQQHSDPLVIENFLTRLDDGEDLI